MVTYSVDTEALIEEVKKRPGLWDTSVMAYTDRFQRRRYWEEIVEALSDNANDLTPQDKTVISESIKKRWKNIKDCFLREIREKKAAMNDNRSRKSEYAYFKTLSFLLKSCPDAQDLDFTEPIAEVNVPAPPEPKKKRLIIKTEPEPEHYPFEVHSMDDTEFNDSSRKEEEDVLNDDEDRMFLLSLVSAMKKIPESAKIGTKIKILALIEEAQKVKPPGWP